MENIAGERGLITSNIFHTNLCNFLKNSNCNKGYSKNARGLKLGNNYFATFDTLFSFLLSSL